MNVDGPSSERAISHAPHHEVVFISLNLVYPLYAKGNPYGR